MNHALANLSVKELNRAIKLKTKIETLEAELGEILGSETPSAKPGPVILRVKTSH